MENYTKNELRNQKIISSNNLSDQNSKSNAFINRISFPNTLEDKSDKNRDEKNYSYFKKENLFNPQEYLLKEKLNEFNKKHHNEKSSKNEYNNLYKNLGNESDRRGISIL